MDETGIGNAVQKIIDLTHETQRTRILDAQLEPKDRYYLIGPDGKAELKTAVAARHAETLDTPAELRRFVETLADSPGTVFLGEDRIVYTYDIDDRRDVATVPLRKNEPYRWLEQPQKQMTQTDFVRVLRITFRGCLTSENLLPLVRELKFDSSAAAQGSIQQGRESMGRQIQAAVTGADKLPDEISLVMPVFENHPRKAQIMCALEVFPQEGTFRLTPYPLEVKTAMDVVMSDLFDLFNDKGLPPVYRGKP